MSVSFASLEIARSGLMVSERGLDTTGHNIANVNTPGYSRQQTMITTANYESTGKYQLGLGADVQEVRQIRQTFLDNVYRQENQTMGYWETRQKTYTDVQAIVGDPMNSGLQNVMNDFWNSWQELSKNPDSLTVRAQVLQRGTALTQYLNHTGDQMDKLQTDLDSEIKTKVDELNSTTGKIAKLNVQILSIENSGDKANDLRDQRNSLLDSVSQMVDCQINEMQDGQVDVTVGGYFLVNKGTTQKVTITENKVGSMFVAPAIDNGNIILPINGGSLKGLMESRGEVVGAKGSTENGSPNDKVDLVFAFNTDDTSTQRDNLVKNISQIVNTYSSQGIGVRLGYTTFSSIDPGTPVAFFTPAKDANGVYAPTQSDLKNFTDAINTIGFTDPASSIPEGQAVSALKSAESDVMTQDSTDGWKNTARQFVMFSDNAIDSTGLIDLGNQFNKDDVHVRTISSATGTDKDQMTKLSSMTNDQFTSPANLGEQSDSILEGVRNAVYGDMKSTKDIIPDIRNNINILVNALAGQVNSLHRSGTTLDGKQGMNFFVPIDSAYPIEMGNIQINPNLVNNVNAVVASSDGSAGGNTVAASMSDLRNKAILGSSTDVQNFDGYYTSVIQTLGSGGSEAQTIGDSQQTLVDSVDQKRQSIMNVSMDEEMSNMMKFQYAYGASARILTVIDGMLDSVINRMIR